MNVNGYTFMGSDSGFFFFFFFFFLFCFPSPFKLGHSRSTSDSKARGFGFDTRSDHLLSFLLPPIQEGQLSFTGESMYT